MKKFTGIISTILSVLLVIGALVLAIGAIGEFMGCKMDSGREWSTINNFFTIY